MMGAGTFKVTWQDLGREPQCPANPQYPDGIQLRMVQVGEVCCTLRLPYPAPRVGMWSVECLLCGLTLRITAAGRADDPHSAIVPCKPLSRA